MNMEDIKIELTPQNYIKTNVMQEYNTQSTQNFTANPLQQQKQATSPTFNYSFSKSAHPIACIATLIFKILALIFYLVIGYFMSNVITFICVLMLSSFDFWTVKNVSGRLLLGLRWWNQCDEQGNSIWKFQSYNKQFKTNAADRMFFWLTQFGNTLVWLFFLLLNVVTINFFWVFLNFILFLLSFINLYGFYRCRKDYNKKIELLKNQKIGEMASKIFY